MWSVCTEASVVVVCCLVIVVVDSSGSPVGAKWDLAACCDDCDRDRLSHMIHQHNLTSTAGVCVHVCVGGWVLCVCECVCE